MSKLRTGFLLIVYCVFLLLAYDFIYSTFIYARPPTAGIPNPVYSHGLAPNFSGEVAWGEVRYPFFTNSVGFRDAAVRDVPHVAANRRILLIGDSFTEGHGVTFEESYAGLLYRAGKQQRIEFLNAGVESYSPTIYLAKIKFLLEQGFKFDEVIVFSDISDVQDEALRYFCFDNEPRYKAKCGWVPPPPPESPRHPRENFLITDRTLSILKHKLSILKHKLFPGKYGLIGLVSDNDIVRSAWTLPGSDVSGQYGSLGVEGGIERSIVHMHALADLLAQRDIPLTVVVYPWPTQLYKNDRDSWQVRIWRDFCIKRCKRFIDAFPAFFAQKDTDPNWYQRLFIVGDVHMTAAGNRVMFEAVARQLF